MKISSIHGLRAYLESMIYPSANNTMIKKSLWALNILERGYITEQQLTKLQLNGFKIAS